MIALIRVKNHLKFLLISYRSCFYGLNGWLRLFGRMQLQVHLPPRMQLLLPPSSLGWGVTLHLPS